MSNLFSNRLTNHAVSRLRERSSVATTERIESELDAQHEYGTRQTSVLENTDKYISARKGSQMSAITTDGRKSTVTRDISMLEFSKEIRRRNQKIEEVLQNRALN